MPRTQNITMYANNITLQKIKDVIMPTGNINIFLNAIFDVLKNDSCDCFTQSYKGIFPSHRSSFVNGNYDRIKNNDSTKTKRLNVDNLKKWADKLNRQDCLNSFFNTVIQCTNNLTHEQINKLCKLFEEDKEHMPDEFRDSIQTAFDDSYYGYAVSLLILWSIYGEDQISLLANCYQQNNYVSPKLISRYITPKSVFLGRDTVIDSIHQKLFNYNFGFIFLQGMGGSGKSEIAKQYAKKYKDYYKTIIFAEYNKSLIELTNDNTVFSLSKPFISERIRLSDGSYESDVSYYKRKLEQIRLSANQKTLIILDNVDYQDDSLTDFLTGFCKIIITTRCNMHLDYPQETICIEGIDDIKICRSIFSSYYGRDVSGDNYVDKIIQHYSGHPMALELSAKQMRVSECTSAQLWEILNTSRESTFEEGYSLQYKTNKEQNIFAHICQLFEISNLNQNESYILSVLSMLPKKGIEKQKLKTLCEQNNYISINTLERLSWVRNLDGVITIHSLVKEAVFLSLKPDLKTCRKYVDKLMEMFSSYNFYYAELSEKDYMYAYTIHLYRLFPEPDVTFYKYYEWIELILSHKSEAEEALRLANKLYELYMTEFGENCFRTGRILCRIGCNYKNLLNYDNAKYYLEKGAEILRNLKNKDKDILRYLSDVDIPLIDLYLYLYTQEKEEKYAFLIQECCAEAIRIRTDLKGFFPEIQTNLVFVYCTLSRLFIYKNDLQKAEEYLNAALNEFETLSVSDNFNSEYLKVYILITKSELEIAKKNLQEAKLLIDMALEIRKKYFSFQESDSSMNSNFLRIKLADSYSAIGKTSTAHIQYQKLLNELKEYDTYTGLIKTIINKCEELTECE